MNTDKWVEGSGGVNRRAEERECFNLLIKGK